VALDTSRQWPDSLENSRPDHRLRYKFAADKVLGRTLDAACGVGYGSWLLSQKVQVVGIDNYKLAILWARERFSGPEYILGDITEAPWDGDFETIVSLETIEHMKDPAPALKAFRKSCKGNFIVSVPNEEVYKFEAEIFKNDLSPHYRHYTPQQFETLLNEHGFIVEGRFCQVGKKAPDVVEGTNGKYLIYVCR
jgi:2-polyprenyl-3-methyl-5-hydroxy-6-metoxy-1,4-benzoquinol methylase